MKKYILISPVKLAVSSIIMISILTILVYLVYNMIFGIQSCYSYSQTIQEKQTEITEVSEPIVYKYSFNIGGETLYTNDDDVYIKLLENKLLEYKTDSRVTDMQNTDERYLKKILKDDYEIYNTYKYALQFGSSDINISDLKIIQKYCKEYNINMHLWLSLVELESGYRSKISNEGSIGYGQITYSTGKWIYEEKLKLGTYNHNMLYNKELNSRLSIYYLSMLISENKTIESSLIRYNGNELGSRYPNVIAKYLKKNSGLTFSQATMF